MKDKHYIEIEDLNLRNGHDMEALKIIEKFKMDSEGEITVTGTSNEWLILISYIINFK